MFLRCLADESTHPIQHSKLAGISISFGDCIGIRQRMVVAITTDDTDHFGIEFITDPSDVVSPPRLELAHGFSHEFMPSLKVVNLMCEVSHLSHGISDKMVYRLY